MSESTNFAPFIPIVVAVVVIVILIILLLSMYKKSRTNEVIIVTGAFLKGPKVVKGGGVFVVPFFQQYDILDLSAFTLSLDVESNTSTQVPLSIEGTATLNIADDMDAIATAARKFSGLTRESRDSQLSEVVRGIVRGILGDMRPENVSNNKKEFSEKVTDELEPKLQEFGIEVTSVQINDVTDENGYLKSLYAEDVANKQADAEEARARAEARAAATQAAQAQIAQEARQKSEKLMAEREKDTAIAKAQYKAEQDKEQAKADQAYDLARAEASKATIAAEGEANAIAAQREAETAKYNVDVEKQRLEAQVIAKTNADAQARKINAEAEAETARIIASADSFKQTELARGAAEATRLDGAAQAEALKEKGLAEAEVKEALAKALSKEGNAVLQQLIIEKLPEIAQAFADSMKSIDNLTVFNGTDGVTGTVSGGMAQTLEFVKQSTGLDLADMATKRANGTVTITDSNKEKEELVEAAAVLKGKE